MGRERSFCEKAEQNKTKLAGTSQNDRNYQEILRTNLRYRYKGSRSGQM